MRLTDAQAVPLSSLADSKLLALSRHWGRIGVVAMRRFLATLPEILRRGLYRRCGCQSVFEYAAKFSTATREVVNDILHVHRQIGNYPALWTLFVDGKVGLTALRRISPRVNPETVDWWAGIATSCTLREIEAVIRASEPPRRERASGLPEPLGTLFRSSQPGVAQIPPAAGAVSPPAPLPLLDGPSASLAAMPSASPEGNSSASPAGSSIAAGFPSDSEPQPPAAYRDLQGSGGPYHGSVPLTPLAAQILEALAHDYERRGQTLSKAELIEIVLKSAAINGAAREPEPPQSQTCDSVTPVPPVRRVRLPRVLIELADVGMTFMRTIGGLIPLSAAETTAFDSGKAPISYTDLLAQATDAGLRATGRKPPSIVSLAIAIRSAGRCEAGSCDRPLQEIDHLDPYSEQPVHRPDRMVGLCRTCHRARHNGLIDNPAAPPSHWRFIGVSGARPLSRVDRQVQARRAEAQQAVLSTG